jgi:type VI secretion system protein ImpC
VDVQALIRDLVAPHIVQDSTPFQAQYVAAVDAAIGEAVRALLHHPSFQSLESNWLGIRWLVNTLDLDEAVRLELFDVSRDELRVDLGAAQGELDRSGLARALISRSSGEDKVPWSLLVGHFTFGESEEDIALLAALGAIAQQVGAPWIAAADATLLGCTSLVQTPEPMDWKPLAGEAAGRWQKLRESPMAAWIGLAHPRVLLRLPYGPATDEIELFEFDERAAARDHESLLWGNPAIVCALLLGQAFMRSGWDMEPGDEVEIDDLPALIVDRDGEKGLQPCAEVLLSDRAAQVILQTGVMPLLGFRNRNAARLMRFQSIADPPQPLAGPWTR